MPKATEAADPGKEAGSLGPAGREAPVPRVAARIPAPEDPAVVNHPAARAAVADRLADPAAVIPPEVRAAAATDRPAARADPVAPADQEEVEEVEVDRAEAVVENNRQVVTF